MAEQLSIEPCTLIPASTSVAEAQAMLEEGKLAIILNEDQPLALAQASDFHTLGDSSQQKLAEVLSHFASPVLIETTTMSSTTMVDLLVLLDERKIPGLILYREQQIEGVISLDALTDILPLDVLPLPSISREPYGNPQTPARAYICHKCEQDDPPPPILLPNQGDRAPTCPKHWLHGSMTLIKNEGE